MRTVRILVVAVAGVVVAATGLWFSTAAHTTGFGWTAYAPLSTESYPVFVGAPWWALALVVGGSMTAGAAGTLVAVRRRRQPSAR